VGSAEERPLLSLMLDEQEQLLKQLRGAYFMIISGTLPWHHRYYMTRREDDFDPLDAEMGRRRFQEVQDELTELFTRMNEVAPDYARKRMSKGATIEELVSCISSHASG
jgi:hypothetical protein